jgi:hypothetical protein
MMRRWKARSLIEQALPRGVGCGALVLCPKTLEQDTPQTLRMTSERQHEMRDTIFGEVLRQLDQELFPSVVQIGDLE